MPMAIRSHLTWALALTALSVAVTDATASANPTTAPTAAHAVITRPAENPANGWVTTTDQLSGISVMLPGQPTVEKTTATVAGESIPIRTYTGEYSGAKGVVVFQVIDTTSDTADLDAAIQSAALTTGSNGTVTSSRHFVLDGHPALDGRYTGTINSTPVVGLARFVSNGNHFVGILTVGEVADENTFARFYQQVLGTLQLSKPHR